MDEHLILVHQTIPPCLLEPVRYWTHTEQATGSAQSFAPPILALKLVKPADGLPLLQDWLVTAADIYRGGLEGWRETIEVRCDEPSCLGQPVVPGCLRPTKGIGRSSMLMFGLLYTFLNFKESMSQEECQDFARPAVGQDDRVQNLK